MANIVKDFASPNGPILLLSAKGLTTASIAESNGVKDFSGNGNHGQAFGGVTVVNDVDLGECFSFDGQTNMYLLVKHTLFQSASSFTVTFEMKGPSDQTNVWLITASNGSTTGAFFRFGGSDRVLATLNYAGEFGQGDTGKCFSGPEGSVIYDNKPHFVTYTIDIQQKIAYMTVDGSMTGQESFDSVGNANFACTDYVIGKAWTSYTGRANYKGLLNNFRIYPRALSLNEIKYLYNGFQPNLIIGQTIPSGAILDLSARGLTTSGIAQANGVVDRSGNGNHGQAYNGVAVVNDDEMGSCFSFDGTGYIEGSTSVSPTSMTFVFLFSYYFTDTQAQSCLISFNPSNRIGGLYLERNNKKIKFYNATSSGPGNYYTNTLFEQNTLYHIVAVSDAVNGLKLYVNGILDAEYDNVYLTHSTTFSYGIGNSTQTGGNKLKGKMSDIRIYPCALSAAEVQQLADASLKKVRGVSMGSEIIKHIYYGSSLVYAKTDNYTYNGTPTEVSFKIHQLNSSSKRNTIEYTGNNANFASITYPNNVCDMGDWSNWINDHFIPVMLKSNGTVDYELNRDNLNYKSDGSTPSDIANTSYDGNAMLQIKKFYISVTSTTEDSHEVFNVNISDTKKDSSYTCYGFVDKDGNEQDFAYYSLFHCYIDSNNKLRSKAGVTLSSFTNQGNFSTMRTAAINNGSGWDISNYALENAIGLVLMMLYKDVNPMFVHQDSSNNYRETSTTPYATTGALATSGGFPWTTTSTMPKALWIESYWRNAAIPGLACNIWINGLGSLKNATNASGFGIYYKLTPPYDLSTPSLWTYMSNTIPYIYVSNAHQIQDVTVYENLLFPKGNGPDAIGGSSGMVSAYYNRFWGGGDINGGLSTSYHSNTTEIKPVKNGFYRALNQWTAPPHYLCYNAFGSSTRSEHVNGSARLTYLKNSN